MIDLDKTGDFQPDGTNSQAVDPAVILPPRVGRYRIEKQLGHGGFGLVYLAHDDQLQRLVAIKVPHRKLVDHPQAAEAYLTEARTVAKLDHPNIVPVYDVGSTEDCPCYVVSKYVDGTDLATRLKHSRLSVREAVELVATVAEALHHAHKQGLVHRDIKPGNLLLDQTGKPFVADFGLALREQDVGKGPRYAGTPAYMSPEQARGEGHRVDGRSDIFSLGVVFYELLAGRQPFLGETSADLLERVTSQEPRPLLQYDEKLPKELQRICMKALSKRASERYSSAHEMAEDLRQFLLFEQAALPSGATSGGIALVPSESHATQVASTAVRSVSATSASVGLASTVKPPITIVPKGLRSFDAHDADFFLELLPGPRDRDGLPDSIRFWKTQIEETDADNTFTVGLIYGPSGCGKSSLVKAGLLPRLSKDVIPVYIEATPEETETGLLHGLRKRFPTLDANLCLKETLAALRRGQGLRVGKKVLIVLDQFEQFLHAKSDLDNTELVEALRQCDGGHVQCILMVRDDFWLAVSRFLRKLEVRLLEGQNIALADLFDLDHAQKVMAALGRAFGKLPDNLGDLDTEQRRFLKESVAGLADAGKVICVRLALFAEMMKGKPWTPATLKEVGGTTGVGVTFLEETFSSSTASPGHRFHQKAARAVLKALLPESGGTDIKGQMKSYEELLEASGYTRRPKDFDDLVNILDSEIRLITPTDPEGKAMEGDSVLPTNPGQKYYQLTHDYLVHSLRDWLTRKQKETRRGRAELLLADRAAVWTARPENRQLPTLVQWLQIKWFTQKKTWTPPQKKMMAKASRYQTARAMVAGVFFAAALFAGLMIQRKVNEQKRASQAAELAIRTEAEQQRKATHAMGLVHAVLKADTAQTPAVIAEISEYRQWADPLLRAESDKATADSPQKLHASLALLPVDATQVDFLAGRLLDAQPNEVPVIRDALAPHKEALTDKLWAVAEAPEKAMAPRRLRAAAALAKYDPQSAKWAKCSRLVVNDLVQENPVYLGQWSEAFQPVKQALLVPLADIFRDRDAERASERILAANILADYAADRPQFLANLLMDADEKQFAAIYSKFKLQAEQAVPLLTSEIDKKLPAELPLSDDLREKLAKRQANAAVALLRMNQLERVWPLLKHSPDPRVRSYLIDRLSPLGADAGVIIKRIDDETDVTIRRALILSLGEFGKEELSPDDRKTLSLKLQEMYRADDDPGLHAASEWLLRRWGVPLPELPVGEPAWFDEKKPPIAKAAAQNARWEGVRRWYVNGQGQTMVVIPGPVEFMIGEADAGQHKRRIGRSFALANKPVTFEQYRQFELGYSGPEVSTRLPDLPVVGIDWHRGAKYCNWLSQQERIHPDQWCYEITGNEIKLKANYLSLGGYRLPTEAEMEYATRAGSLTSRFFGETEDLLPKYAWYFKNSEEKPWPVGSLKPNDLGLFDVLGNVWTWCQESYKGSSQGSEAVEDKEDYLEVVSTTLRVLRGGSFNVQASKVRSACRNITVPTVRSFTNGFRVARTLPTGSSDLVTRISP